MTGRLRTWLRSHPELFDRIKPVVRRVRGEPPLNRELRKLLSPLRNITVLQIGAHDGITHDPYREYLIRPDWRSVVVEPNPAVFEVLRRNYSAYPNVTPVNAAVAYDRTELQLWGVDTQFLSTRADAAVLSTLVSFSRENMLQFIAPSDPAAQHLVPFSVGCLTVEQLVEKAGWSNVDALFVDVEGFENQILLNTQLNRLRPRIIVFENHLLADKGAEIKSMLSSEGYRTLDVESDTIAIRKQ